MQLDNAKIKRYEVLQKVAAEAAKQMLPFQIDPPTLSSYDPGGELPHAGLELGTDKNWYVKFTHGPMLLTTAGYGPPWDTFGKLFPIFLDQYSKARTDELARMIKATEDFEALFG